ncbi:MAG: hypothetical protein FWF80_08270 [Defluviitaleaceae bacterium]|nr:hypothetical protein [Defluviitaleaceae bacterium]
MAQWETLEQINRTIFFDVINPNIGNLSSILNFKQKNIGLGDQSVKEIHKRLLVGDFNEFLNKFKPAVYSYFKDKNGEIGFLIDLKDVRAVGKQLHEIPLDKDSGFLRLLIEMIESRSKSSNIGFLNKNDDFGHSLFEHSDIDNFRIMRSKVRNLFKAYVKNFSAEIKNEIDDELSKLNVFLKNHVDYIYLMLNDMEMLQNRTQKELLQADFDEKFALRLVRSPVKVHDFTELEKDVEAEFCKYIKAYYNDYGEFSEKLFSPSYTEELVQEYRLRYSNALKEFLYTVKPLVEKILGIYAFFKHYKTGKMAPKLLIYNASVKDITEENNVEKLKIFLKTVNTTGERKEAVWLAVVLNYDTANEYENGTLNVGEYKYYDTVKVSEMNKLLEVTNAQDISTFFSFTPNLRNTFSFLNKDADSVAERLTDYEDACEKIDDNKRVYAIPCFPNLTLIPYENATVEMNRRKINMYGIYIPAAFLAAGLFASYQCPYYLKLKLRNTEHVLSENYPGTMVDFTDDEISGFLQTGFGKEITGYSDAVKQALKGANFGFVLSSDYDFISIYIANNLKKKPVNINHLVLYIRRLTLSICNSESEKTKFLADCKKKWEQDKKNNILNAPDSLIFADNGN